jgi:hypothetical protein
MPGPSRVITRYIPGHPTFVPQNMPGAGSRVAGNWLYNLAPKDGTAIGTLVQSSAIDQALQEPGIRFEAAKFNWIGNPTVDNLVTIAWSAAGLATLEDVKSKGGLFCGGTGGGPTMMFPQIVNRLMGTRIKVVRLSRRERGQPRHGAGRGELRGRHHLVVDQVDDARGAGRTEDRYPGAMGHRQGPRDRGLRQARGATRAGDGAE